MSGKVKRLVCLFIVNQFILSVLGRKRTLTRGRYITVKRVGLDNRTENRFFFHG